MMNRASFLPEDYQVRRLQRRTDAMCLLLFVVVMAAVSGAYLVTDRQRRQVRQQLTQVDAEFEEAARRLEQFDQLQARKRQIVRKAHVSSVLIEPVPRSVVLAELINHMPREVSLLEFRLDTKTLRAAPKVRTAMEQARRRARGETDEHDIDQAGDDLPRVRPTEVTVELVGVADTDVQVAQFMAALGRSRMFDDLNLSYSQQTKIEDVSMRKFAVRMRLNQEYGS